MDVVSHEGLDSTIQSLQRDSRKAKQLLLEIERVCSKLYQKSEQAYLSDLFSVWLLTWTIFSVSLSFIYTNVCTCF